MAAYGDVGDALSVDAPYIVASASTEFATGVEVVEVVEGMLSNAPPNTSSNTAASPVSTSAKGHNQRRGRVAEGAPDCLPLRSDRMRSDDADASGASASSKLGLLDRCPFEFKRNSL